MEDFLCNPKNKRKKVFHTGESHPSAFTFKKMRHMRDELPKESIKHQSMYAENSVVGQGMTETRGLMFQSSQRKQPVQYNSTRTNHIYSTFFDQDSTGRNQDVQGRTVGRFAKINDIQEIHNDKKVLTPDQLKEILMPTLEVICYQEESLPFRKSADLNQSQSLKKHNKSLPCFTRKNSMGVYNIIKKTMNLSTIIRKLVLDQYREPWQYIEDVWLVFDNAWLYNRKTSLDYKYATKLAKLFEQEIDPVMQSLGYCCGRRYVFQPKVLSCCRDELCTIPRYASYWSYQNNDVVKNSGRPNDRYIYCQTCFLQIPGGDVALQDHRNQSKVLVKKEQFVEMTNNETEKEPFVKCKECEWKFHQICVLHLDAIWPEGYTCDNCSKSKGCKKKENEFRARRLHRTELGNFIECGVNSYLKTKDPAATEVTIRVVFNSNKNFQVKPGMRRTYVETGEWPESFPYREKALFAFQEIDGVDVCFFGMYLQEYGSDCAMPNTRRVYLAYLDSVPFFQPKNLRTEVHHEILLGYLNYAKQLGYAAVHIWACPPGENVDYIFDSHPAEQRYPTPNRLQEWYRNMVAKGISDKIVLGYKNIMEQATDDNFSDASQLPYFDGDFWPDFLEKTIKELDEEDECEKPGIYGTSLSSPAYQINDGISEALDISKKTGETRRVKRGLDEHSRNAGNHKRQKVVTDSSNNLTMKVYSAMKKNKDVFSVIVLHSVEDAARLPQIEDPDPFIYCGMMDTRNAFLRVSRENHYEFSSLRRAKHSTMAIIQRLHSYYGQTNLKQSQLENVHLNLSELCIHSLLHARHCTEANCKFPRCHKIKTVSQHVRFCKRKTAGNCPKCSHFAELYRFHAKLCQEDTCPIEHCSAIKQHLRKQRPKEERLGSSPDLAPGSLTSSQRYQLLKATKINPQLMTGFASQDRTQQQQTEEQVVPLATVSSEKRTNSLNIIQEQNQKLPTTGNDSKSVQSKAPQRWTQNQQTVPTTQQQQVLVLPIQTFSNAQNHGQYFQYLVQPQLVHSVATLTQSPFTAQLQSPEWLPLSVTALPQQQSVEALGVQLLQSVASPNSQQNELVISLTPQPAASPAPNYSLQQSPITTQLQSPECLPLSVTALPQQQSVEALGVQLLQSVVSPNSQPNQLVISFSPQPAASLVPNYSVQENNFFQQQAGHTYHSKYL